MDKSTDTRRPCNISSNNFSLDGWCHCVFVSKDGAYAVVEDETGRVQSFKIAGPGTYHSIWFKDPQQLPQKD